MTQQIAFTIDFANYQQNRIAISMKAHYSELIFEALAVENGVTIEGLEIKDLQGNSVSYTQKANQLTIETPSDYHLEYQLHMVYQACVGADREYYLIYPFITSDEIFIGAGALPRPADEEAPYQIIFKNLPEGFSVFSNLEPILPEKLESFFLYASRDQHPHSFDYHYASNNHMLTLNFLIQHGKTIPLTLDALYGHLRDWLAFLEKQIAPYTQTDHLNILILQAPDHFEQLANGRSFATGENMMHGIIAYAPSGGDYLEKLSGNPDYAYYLVDGFTHEIGHLYTSAARSQNKSILYAAHNCPPVDRMLIGESLNGYLHRLYMYSAYHKDISLFFSQEIPHWLKSGRRSQLLLKWFLMDVALRQQHGITVWQVFQQIIENNSEGYSSASDLIPYPEILAIEPTPEAIKNAIAGIEPADFAI